ncbi:RidA/YER057c/UK114 superfamily, group 2, YoaB-like protein [plant metagenome]|uniref:RidA/YER057c/UK114 superfamily, group 2, YoaB-like protein n=2 Tax=root TaxID=1 RepID=A0A1C3K8I3_9BURK|nr:RidA family protein [Orrella dioscoreae]SBT27806.1 RidA/YER057c/UK114 superfamily, group 2, YoaB-like protein [Orrella dioscoreae]SOE49299.1 RidA/YER057c/UK114 superfamily, group 2, YoaB-like protein [Orrella dioscoreae]
MNTDIQRIDTNARMSHVVVHNGVAYLAGSVAKDYAGGLRQQAAEALADIEQTLQTVGSNKSRILSAQIWLKDLSRDFKDMNAVWEAWLPEGAAPARATCQVDMADPAILIEIIVTAAV